MKYPVILLLIVLVFIFISCDNSTQQKATQGSENDELSNLSGEALAKMYCGSCHAFTEPNLLDKKTWKHGLLPQMGYRMGIYGETSRQSLIEKGPGGTLVERKKIFPKKPLISEKEWELINKYYYDNAPDSLNVPVKKLKMDIRNLKIEIPEFHISPPLITALKFNPEQNQVYVADTKADYSTINVLDHNLVSMSTLALPSPISHIDYKSDTILATLMGGFMPTDNPNGSVIKIFKGKGKSEYTGFTSILKNLQRPVHSTYVDINDDKLEDIIVCEYGNHTGKLSLFINQSNGKYEKRALSNDPGASAVEIRDLNQDGLVDIVALMAQGKERIDVYLNQGNGAFQVKKLLEFPPCYGSVSFSLIDWNLDGYEDIIYVNGDNADYSTTLKPYHGLRIFLNDGQNNFEEAFFQHQNGAYKAKCHDFDKDGDLDIAMISFFPDLINSPVEGFIFMENVSIRDSVLFDIHSFEEASKGRWLVMEMLDVNKNNFPELILGSFAGMGVNGDVDGKVAARLVKNSPTLMKLTFD